jgi:hypothetical protein
MIREADDFPAWLAAAEPGELTTYHIGFLMLDREGNLRVAAKARAAMRASDEGFVMLTQYRVQEGLYVYKATRTGEIYE